MPDQTSSRVAVYFKEEEVYGTPESAGAGATRLRLLDSDGLVYERGEIPSEERRPDQLEGVARIGGADVTGSYLTETNPGGAFDLLLAASVRGTPSALAQQSTIDTDVQLTQVYPDAVPTDRGFTVEQRDIDIDQSELFYGVRLTQMDIALEPKQRAKFTWTFRGLSRNILSTSQSPWFTTPEETTGESLIVDDAVISYAGSIITTLTGINISVPIANATQDVIGSLVNSNVYTNRLTVTGDVSAIRQDLSALQDFDDETEFEIKGVLKNPGAAPQLTFAFRMPRVKILGIRAPFLQGDTAKVESRNFKAFAPAGATNVIELFSSTGTPTAYGV